MRVLVTGGCGFIGSNLARGLVESGYDVTVMDSLHTGSRDNLKGLPNSVRFVEGACQDLAKSGLKGFDMIMHFGIYSSSPMYKDNPMLVGEAVKDAIAVFEFARENGSGVVFASSSSIYSGLGLPFKEDMKPLVSDYYTEARYAIERLAELYHKLHGVSSTALRLFSVYGPNEEAKGRFANVITQMILQGEFVIYGDGNQSRDFIYVSDVVRAAMLAMQKCRGFSVYNVGTGRETTFNEVADIIKGFMTLQTSNKPNPIGNYVDRTCADTTMMRSELGFSPEVSLEEGISKTIENYKSLEEKSGA